MVSAEVFLRIAVVSGNEAVEVVGEEEHRAVPQGAPDIVEVFEGAVERGPLGDPVVIDGGGGEDEDQPADAVGRFAGGEVADPLEGGDVGIGEFAFPVGVEQPRTAAEKPHFLMEMAAEALSLKPMAMAMASRMVDLPVPFSPTRKVTGCSKVRLFS